MDLSALIFVALAVAWACYLVPMAIRHHDDVARGRSVERFSHTMRVLARRESVTARRSRAVVSPGRPATAPVVVTKQTVVGSGQPFAGAPADPRPPAVRRAAAARAAARRRRVLVAVLSVLAVVVLLAAVGVVAWVWTAAPAALLLAWLSACRMMVRRESGVAHEAALRRARRRDARDERRDERRERRIARRREREEDFFGDYEPPVAIAPEDPGDPTDEISAVVANARSSVQDAIESGVWEPVPLTLPTYVDKAPAARTVRTIDLDSTGVWSSGRSEADSALVREAEDAERVEKARAEERRHRATGS